MYRNALRENKEEVNESYIDKDVCIKCWAALRVINWECDHVVK